MVKPFYSTSLPRIDAFPHATISQPSATLHISAQAAWDDDGAIAGDDDLDAQVRQCWRNIGRIAAEAGFSMRGTTSSVAYVVDLDDAKVVNYARMFHMAIAAGEATPHATTLVGVTRLPHPGMLVEIAATVQMI